LLGPIVLSSLIDVRERTLALEARAFGANARRTAYRVVPDPPVDRWLRLALLGTFLLLVGAILTGALR
jgi:energy-coupling factor transport system permease protein